MVMILSIEFNGYKFFSDNSALSFSADARTKKLLSNSTVLNGKNVLKAVGLYGSNNSGKTNLYKLFGYIKLVLDGKDNIEFNIREFGDSSDIRISIIFNNFTTNGWIRYTFNYNQDRNQYDYESIDQITFYESGKRLEKNVFEKDVNNKVLKVFGDDSYSKYINIISSRVPFLYSIELKDNEFSSLYNYYEEIRALFNSIELFSMYNIPIENTLNAMKNDDKNKISFIKEFVKNADVSIDDFAYDENAMINITTPEINEEALNRITKISDSLKFVTTYGNVKVPSFLFDSTGTKKIEAIASYIYDALKKGKTLVIDEIDNGLHYKLTRSIVSVFNNMANTRGQLFFITHDLLLIDCNKLMRKDQIYFLNRNKNKAELFCLKNATAESGGLREVNDIIKHYNRGEFGNVPNPDFISLLLGVEDCE